MSRYFTYNCLELHFPNDTSHIEVTDDGRYLSVKDDGRALESDSLKVAAIEACLRYVESGHWIEVDAQRRPLKPTGTYIGEDHW